MVGGFLAESLRAPCGYTTVLLTLHEDCADCAGYLRQLEQSRAELDIWDARLQVHHGAPGLVVADRYGQIFYQTSAHDFPAPRQLEEWVKYLGTLCPE